MTYVLEALLGRSAVIEKGAKDFKAAITVQLGRGLSMIPVSGALIEELSFNAGDEVDECHGSEFFQEGFEKLGPELRKWAMVLSQHGSVAYIAAEYWAGAGSQSAVVWDEGDLVLGPLRTDTSQVERSQLAVNETLRYFGVKNDSKHADEFDSVGLGRERMTEDWTSTKSNVIHVQQSKHLDNVTREALEHAEVFDEVEIVGIGSHISSAIDVANGLVAKGVTIRKILTTFIDVTPVDSQARNRVAQVQRPKMQLWMSKNGICPPSR